MSGSESASHDEYAHVSVTRQKIGNLLSAILILCMFSYGFVYSPGGYLKSGPVSGTILATDFVPKHDLVLDNGRRVTAYNNVDKWTAEIDLNKDGNTDRTIYINENDFNTLTSGSAFKR